MVKRALSVLAVAVALSLGAGVAAAVEPVAPDPVMAPAPGTATPAPAPEPTGPVAVDQKRGKGSGFWTSDVPTEDRPYRWTYMLIGLSVVAVMGLIVFLLIRRNAGTGTSARPAP